MIVIPRTALETQVVNCIKPRNRIGNICAFIKIKSKAIAMTVVFVGSFSFCAQVSGANFVEEVMGGVLGGMTNTTSPQAYSAANRGVISGGGFTTRTRIFNPTLLAFVPPSFKAGCGGIDMFGGSFSYINAEQLVQVFRAVAANAVGLLFQMALKVVCSMCETLIQHFQDIIREINSLISNTCRMADGIVNMGKDLINNKSINIASKDNMFKGVGDAFSTFFDDVKGLASGGPTGTAIDTDEQKAAENNLFGNIIWRAIKSEDLSSRYIFKGQDQDEIIMSVTGTVVIEKPTNTTSKSADGKRDNTVDSTSKTTPVAPTISLKDFIEGSNANTPASLLTCRDGKGEDQCMEVDKSKYISKGFVNGMYEILCGSSDLEAKYEGGVVRALATNNEGSGDSLPENQQAVVVDLPMGLGAMISQLSVIGTKIGSPTTACGDFVKEFIKPISLLYAYDVMNQIYDSAIEVAEKQKGAHIEKLLKDIKDYQKAKGIEFSNLTKEYGSIIQMQKRYNEYIEGIQRAPKLSKYLINQTKINVSN